MLPQTAMPAHLRALCTRLAAAAGHAMAPDAAIVNYYSPGSTMGGRAPRHLDSSHSLIALLIWCAVWCIKSGRARR
jgi:alkylated DNA repair dioxygenase AlkB